MAASFPKAQLNSTEAVRLWNQEHSEWAKEQIILANVGLIRMCMKKMNFQTNDEELLDIGMIGLCKAVNTFDASKGYQFSTYAAALIRNEFLMYFRSQKRSVQAVISLDAPVTNNDASQISSSDKETTYQDLLKDPKSIEDQVTTKMLLEWMQKNLAQREWKMIKLRLNGKTHQEIANQCGLSKTMVSRTFQIIQKKVLRAGWERP